MTDEMEKPRQRRRKAKSRTPLELAPLDAGTGEAAAKVSSTAIAWPVPNAMHRHLLKVGYGTSAYAGRGVGAWLDARIAEHSRFAELLLKVALLQGMGHKPPASLAWPDQKKTAPVSPPQPFHGNIDLF